MPPEFAAMHPDDSAASGRLQVEIRCEIEPAMLRLLREVINSIANHLGFSDKQASEIEICVDEACANTIEHAYQTTHAEQKTISIQISFDAGELNIRVCDSGQGLSKAFEVSSTALDQYTAPDREHFRGLGFYMMHKLMDRVDVRTTPGQGTTVEMIKIRK